MPYKCLPRWMVCEIVTMGNTFLNAIEEKCASDVLATRTIIDNLPHIDYNNIKYKTKEYVQIHTSDSTTNSMQPRTIGAIVTGPQNIIGRYNFMPSETGRDINGRIVKRMPDY